jgi:hypothetical protein
MWHMPMGADGFTYVTHTHSKAFNLQTNNMMHKLLLLSKRRRDGAKVKLCLETVYQMQLAIFHTMQSSRPS